VGLRGRRRNKVTFDSKDTRCRAGQGRIRSVAKVDSGKFRAATGTKTKGRSDVSSRSIIEDTTGCRGTGNLLDVTSTSGRPTEDLVRSRDVLDLRVGYCIGIDIAGSNAALRSKGTKAEGCPLVGC
jgi:hypothetical protein